MLLAACTAPPSPSHAPRALAEQKLLQRHHLVTSSDNDAFLKDCITRLRGQFDASDDLPRSIKILESDAAFAFLGTESIALSRPLVNLVQDEAQFAFIIAHELAHAALKHEADTGREQELEADQKAVEVVFRAGYNARQALLVLSRISNSFEGGSDRDHPPISERMKHGVEALSRLTGFSGITSRRSFLVFRCTMAGAC